MSSANPSFGLPSNPRDTPRTRRYGSATDPTDVVPVDIRQKVSQRRLSNRTPNRQPSQGKTVADTTQTGRARRPELPVAAKPQSTQAPRRVPTMNPPEGYMSTTRIAQPAPSTSTTFKAASPNIVQDAIPVPTRSILRKKQILPTYSRSGGVFHTRGDSERTASSSSSSVDPSLLTQSDRVASQSPDAIQVAHTVELPRTQAHAITIYPELDRYRNIPTQSCGSGDMAFEVPFHLATHDLPLPPTPAYSGTSSQLSTTSPSTRFSESPGPGAYSRDTTPTSVSSQSPGMLASMRFAPHQKPRQQSPAYSRPPVTRRRTGSMSNDVEVSGSDFQGLAAVREALTSSSSNSTVRDGDRSEKVKPKTKQPPTPPKPPPRKSSQKFTEVKTDSSPRRPPQSTTSSTTSPAKVNTSRSRPELQSRATPPSRPSRDGTPDLHSQIPDPPPIVHSNLTHAPSVPERPSTGGRQQSFSPLPRRATPSPSLGKPATRSALVAPGREATPKPRPSLASPLTSPEKATKSANTSTFNTRFPFFSKRSKTAPDLNAVDDKPARKGPVAGTGHEGYGRIGSIRRRSGSLLVGRSNLESEPSRPALNVNRSVDTFLQDRTSPVVISGGEIVHNRNVSSDLSLIDSHQSIGMGRPSCDSRWDSETSTTSSVYRNSNRISSLPRVIRPRVSNRRPSDSSDSEAVAMKSTLAYRRSVQRLRASPEQEPLRIPRPIITSRGASPALNSKDTGFRTDDSMPDSEWEGARGHKATTTPPRKLTKKTKSPRKWNPFSRSQSRPKKTEEPEPVSATVTYVQQPQIPFYAVMDGSEQEDMEPQRIEDVLRDAHVFDGPLDIPTPPRLSVRTKLPSELPEPKPQSPEFRLPPQPRQLRRVDKATINMSVDTAIESADAEARPSRLAQVGRIPKVVNTRIEESPRSFSRPFNRLSYQRLTPVDTLQDQFVAKGPSPPKPSTPELTPETSSGETLSAPNSHATPPDVTTREFLTMSPNKNYQGHTSSSSSGSTNFAFAFELAVLPDPNGPLVEDEIWEEYNDLLGEVPPSATSSKGIPFHLETFSKQAPKRGQVAESPTIAQGAPKVDIPIQEVEECVTDCESECSNISGDMTERIRRAFAPKPEPARSVLRSPRPPTSAPRTPKLNNAAFIKSPARTPKLDEVKQKSPVRTPKPVVELSAKSTPISRSPAASRSPIVSRSPAASQKRASDSSSKSRQSDSSCKSSEDESPLAQVNLRVGSMTVSKWLSFGHVLFSPGREELVPEEGSLKRHSILVIDGLGNDDWSFYAAETYPMATFFNMSPRAPLPKPRQTVNNFPLSPPNHHQIQFVSHLGKFPFGPESFTSVVYRFPAAAPESHYRNIISEARRVLKPGGYIELSLLDVDLNNMGNRGRRVVRQLKERLREKTSDISLGSSSDLAVRLLGSNGFSDIKTCHVGVPVASAITKSDATSAQRTTPRGFKQAKEQRSLADLMNDKSDAADENITKMVAKVGRWWYTRCYESAARGDAAEKSIWTDRALLAECEELRTSLKLMVCYARVPDRSRIASI